MEPDAPLAHIPGGASGGLSEPSVGPKERSLEERREVALHQAGHVVISLAIGVDVTACDGCTWTDDARLILGRHQAALKGVARLLGRNGSLSDADIGRTRSMISRAGADG